MLNKVQPLLFSLSLALLTATPANAINIVTYNLTGATGDQATQAPSTTAINITGLNITRGAGLVVSPAGSSFSSSGFENTSSGATTNEFVQLGFTVASGFTVSLNNLKVGTRSSGTGPGTIRLFFSGDGFLTSSAVGPAISQPNSVGISSTIDLSTLTGLTNTVTFRFYEEGNTSANGSATAVGGTFRLSNFDPNGIVFDGTVTATATPVPFGFSPEFGLVAIGAWASRKWIVKKAKEFKK